MVDAYEGRADVIKIAGRMKPIENLSSILTSYFNRSGNINMLHFFSTQISPVFKGITFNHLMEYGYNDKIWNCQNKCHECKFCDNVLNKIVGG